jgi:signal transduction histidine kinase
LANSNLRAYGLAVLTTAAGLALTRGTWPFFWPTPFAPVFAAVAITTHWGSGRAGLLAILLSGVGAWLTFPATGPNAWTPNAGVFVAFAAVALVGNLLIAGRNRATAALRASEAQLRATLEHLRQSEETLRRAQKMEAVGQLVAGVAHNFNNLLTITMGYTDTLMDRDGDEESNRIAIEEIRKATERGAALTRQLLAFGRKHDPRIARIELGDTVNDLRDMLTRVIREDIELTLEVPAGGAAVMIDPFDLEQVIFNLVINARDALPDGGAILVQVTRERLDESDGPAGAPVPSGDYVCLRVRDNGVGMDPEVQAHLFEPFFTTKEVGEGTGLGLAFVHGIADHGGGFVTVDSAPGKGTTVAVFLPLAPAAALEPAAPAPPVPARDDRPAATILLVEDDAAVRAMTTQMLSRAGFTVLAASNPAEASELFDRTGTIDLLLTDVVMPEMHGPELAHKLAAKRPGLPVLFVSGYGESLAASNPLDGPTAFLAKPFASSALVASVRELLGTHAG